MSVEKKTVDEDHVFITPVKLIKTIEDMQQWDKSEAYFEYLGFILAINESVKGKKGQDSKAWKRLKAKATEVLNQLTEADFQHCFQQWNGVKIAQGVVLLMKDVLFIKEARTVLQEVLPENMYRAIPEIIIYMIGFLTESDQTATACKVFVRYLEVAGNYK
ncbi:hypothetical protein NQ318_010883 [Aromia moschata]|uniref:Serine/threonine-protein phosphatase 2A activator n=1 Tax=Aromia moschata TaxID=1265417 RepID=A0AAV8X5W8_9CUCU|nr:hypothetical protein NQ318_010883 [Aromia moschata]